MIPCLSILMSFGMYMDRKAFVSTSTSSIVSFAASNLLTSMNATDLLTQFDDEGEELYSSHRIDFYGDMTPNSCLNLINILKELKDSDDKMKIDNPQINIHIQSFGGDLMSALFDLKNASKKCKTQKAVNELKKSLSPG